jgi:glycosyltransferase involved in cell wall biosynthesis
MYGGEIKVENITEDNQKKIAIIVKPELTSFISGIQHILSESYNLKTIKVNNIKDAKQDIEWADLVWYEFGNELAITGTNMYPDKKSIIRVHGYEVINGYIAHINNKNTNYIFVADHVRNMLNIPEINNKITIIKNCVNIDKYTFANHTQGNKIAFVGNFNTKKNPALAVMILNELVNKMGLDYEMHWAGDMQDIRLYAYVGHLIVALKLQNKFFLYKKVDTNTFLEDKNYFLSTSIHEGYGMAILEAMCKGIKPIINNFYIADEFYPKKYIFNDINEAVQLITSDKYNSYEYRKFAEENREEKQLKSVNDLVSSLLDNN